MSPNLARLITAEVPHEKFLRMSNCQASSNPRIFLFVFFQQCTTKHCCSEQEKKNLFLPDMLVLTHAVIRADTSIVSVLCLHCWLSSGLHCSFLCFCRYPPLKQQTANRLPANWRLSIQDVFRHSVILHFSDKLKHSGRCMLMESSSV